MKVASAGRVLYFDAFMELTAKVARELPKEMIKKLQEESESKDANKAAIESKMKTIQEMSPEAAEENFWNFLGLHDPNLVLFETLYCLLTLFAQ